ncbi:hypothetical protein TNCV_2445371 [Trichonephila clavipes]|nr:hypothetical protein TNCV_2445371 [Trichonephila clavipes]
MPHAEKHIKHANVPLKKLKNSIVSIRHVRTHGKLLKCPYPKPRKGTNITPNNYATALDNLIRPNTLLSHRPSVTTINSRNPQQMAAPSNARRNPAIFSQKRTNQIVTPTPTNNNINNENNSPQNIILQTLQQTIQALTLLTQQVSNLNFNNPAPKPKKIKVNLLKELQALLEALIDDDDDYRHNLIGLNICSWECKRHFK